jgi:hypothetical protein
MGKNQDPPQHWIIVKIDSAMRYSIFVLTLF